MSFYIFLCISSCHRMCSWTYIPACVISRLRTAHVEFFYRSRYFPSYTLHFGFCLLQSNLGNWTRNRCRASPWSVVLIPCGHLLCCPICHERADKSSHPLLSRLCCTRSNSPQKRTCSFNSLGFNLIGIILIKVIANIIFIKIF